MYPKTDVICKNDLLCCDLFFQLSQSNSVVDVSKIQLTFELPLENIGN